MKGACLLYLCIQEEPYLLKVLSSHYSVYVHRIGADKELENHSWDLVIFQDADVWQKKIFQKLKKFPWLYISTRADIRGYVAPTENLYGVVNIGGAKLSLYGIPEELQICLQRPVDKTADYYFFEREPETCRIVYCPTGNSASENDFKLLSMVHTTNSVLTIVSDQYQALVNAFPAFVEIVPSKYLVSAFKKAHLVVASGHNAVCAMALCKPCIVLGDFGLGGMVTPANYEQLQSVFFRGRKGACFGEVVPLDLLEAEICKTLWDDCSEDMQTIRKKVWNTYSIRIFSTMLFKEVERILDLSATMKSKKERLALKPSLSSVFQQEKFEDKRYMVRGMLRLGVLDEDMSELLSQCDGFLSIQELIERNKFDLVDSITLWENLCELWKEKLILFKL